MSFVQVGSPLPLFFIGDSPLFPVSPLYDILNLRKRSERRGLTVSSCGTTKVKIFLFCFWRFLFFLWINTDSKGKEVPKGEGGNREFRHRELVPETRGSCGIAEDRYRFLPPRTMTVDTHLWSLRRFTGRCECCRGCCLNRLGSTVVRRQLFGPEIFVRRLE